MWSAQVTADLIVAITVIALAVIAATGIVTALVRQHQHVERMANQEEQFRLARERAVNDARSVANRITGTCYERPTWTS